MPIASLARAESRSEKYNKSQDFGYRSDVGYRQVMPFASLRAQFFAQLCCLPCNGSNTAPSTLIYLDRLKRLFCMRVIPAALEPMRAAPCCHHPNS